MNEWKNTKTENRMVERCPWSMSLLQLVAADCLITHSLSLSLFDLQFCWMTVGQWSGGYDLARCSLWSLCLRSWVGDGARLGWVPGGRGWAPGTPPGIMPSICPPMPPGDTPTAPGGNLREHRGNNERHCVMRSSALCSALYHKITDSKASLRWRSLF